MKRCSERYPPTPLLGLDIAVYAPGCVRGAQSHVLALLGGG